MRASESNGKRKVRRAVRKASAVNNVASSSTSKPSGPQLPPRAITANAARQLAQPEGGSSILRTTSDGGKAVKQVTIVDSAAAGLTNSHKPRRSAGNRRRRLSTTGLGLSAAAPTIGAGTPSKANQATAQARKWFDELDVDGSGALDKEEFVQLAQRLGLHSTSRARLAKEFADVDTQGDGEIGFAQFSLWWSRFKEQERRNLRLQVRDLFEKIDVDGDGALDKHEISRLVQKSTGRGGLSALVPPFDLESDWLRMRHHEPVQLPTATADELGEGAAHEPTVSFSAFETWWKERIGFDDVGIPVLPEFLVKKIDDLDARDASYMRRSSDTTANRAGGGTGAAAVGGAPQRRTGRELWRWLRPRLRLMIEMTNAWGDVHKLYESRQDSLFGHEVGRGYSAISRALRAYNAFFLHQFYAMCAP